MILHDAKKSLVISHIERIYAKTLLAQVIYIEENNL